MKKKFLGGTRKIRSISLDTNVIIDLVALRILSSKQRLTKEESSYLERCKSSSGLLSLLLSVNIKTVGTEVVREELSLAPELKALYTETFQSTVSASGRDKSLANKYRKNSGIKPADALILALVSGRADCFLSWNRSDIVRSFTLARLHEINRSAGTKTPLIMTPSEFLERITLSSERSICFFPDVVPQQFRPRFYPSRQLL